MHRKAAGSLRVSLKPVFLITISQRGIQGDWSGFLLPAFAGTGSAGKTGSAGFASLFPSHTWAHRNAPLRLRVERCSGTLPRVWGCPPVSLLYPP